MRDIFSELAAPSLSDEDPVRRAQIQMKQPLPKRFYKEATVAGTPDGYAVHLDGRSVKTPAKQVLVLPTEAAAELVAGEWRAQEQEINPATMPVTRIANSTIDGIIRDPAAVADEIVRFSGTDLICYRADSPSTLVANQQAHWDPILRWVADTHGARFILAEGVMHQEQPAEAIDAFRKALGKHASPFAIGCLHTMTTLMGSALLALAIADKRLTPAEGWAAAHVDEDWNMSQWGSDAEAEARRELRWKELQAAHALLEAL